MAGELNPDNGQDASVRFTNELQLLMDRRAQRLAGLEEQSPTDPFHETYMYIADSIVSLTRVYVGLRMIEEGITDAPQDTR